MLSPHEHLGEPAVSPRYGSHDDEADRHASPLGNEEATIAFQIQRLRLHKESQRRESP